VKTLAVGQQHTNVLGRRGSLTARDNCMRRIPPLNSYDHCLSRELCAWEELIGTEGLNKICCPVGRRKYPTRPWVQMPAEGRQFKPVGISQPLINYAPFNSATSIPVLTVLVPLGYDGVITDYVCEVSAAGATGFVEGSGTVTWRLSADGRYLRDVGNIQVTMGSLIQPSPVPRGGLRVWSHNLIQFSVALETGMEAVLNPAAVVICSINGWFYAR
jgi:hypothetical protein